MIKINLLDKKTKSAQMPFAELTEKLGLSALEPEDWRLIRNTILKAVVLYVGYSASNYIPEEIRQKKIVELEQQNAAADAELRKLEQDLKAKQAVRVEMEKMIASENELKEKLAVVSSLDSDRYRAFKVMDTISLLIPEKVWIDTLTFTSKTLDLNGGSWEFLPINDFVSLLKQSGVFDEVRLKSISTALASKIVSGVPLALQTMKKYEVSMEVKNVSIGVKKDI